ncbi:MAG: hypothetical protein M3017_17885 [Actinomycetota bacterium]|nr:hypothetical protein [Actinomycetota bacterium]
MVAYSVSAATTVTPRAAEELDGLPLYGLSFAVTMATSVVAMAFRSSQPGLPSCRARERGASGWPQEPDRPPGTHPP